ncbi:hypothetical protein AMTRI_Chr07g23670 [Amborella trichopoda]
MADPVVSFLLQKLDKLLTEEVQLLGGVKDDIQWIKDELQIMKPFLNDADKIRERDSVVDAWVAQVRDVVYDAEDVLDNFILRIANIKRRGFIGNLIAPVSVSERKPMILQIEGERLQIQEEASSSSAMSITRDYLQPIFSSVEDDSIVGVDQKNDPHLKEISILGMGGLGKTTLARRIYNGDTVKKHFDCHAWVTVSQSFTVKKIFATALDSLLKDNEEVLKGVEGMEERELQQKLHMYLLDKKYVAVLDDVWRVVHVSFPNSENGSRFIITTRRGDVASPLYVRSEVYKLERLSTDDAWSLFFKKAFWLEDGNTCPMELEEEGRLIVQECDGLPLAIIVVGGGILTLSYKDLPPLLKYCFLYCCLFPKDFEIRCSKLIRLWAAEGFIEGRTVMIHMEVANNCFVKACRVHDMVRKLGLSLCEKEMFEAFDDKQDSKLDIRTRRLSIQNDDSSFYGEKNMSFLRTFFISRFFRVLYLEGIHIECLPDEVGHLIHLRYLGLRKTGVKKVPKCLPTREIRKLADPRHGGVRGRIAEWNIKHKKLDIFECVLSHYHVLRNLRKLKIQLERSEEARSLCTSIQRMDSLRYLHMASPSSETPLHINALSPTQTTLQRLGLVGPLVGGKLPNCVASRRCLCVCVGVIPLQIAGRPICCPALQRLPNLMHLWQGTASNAGKHIGKCSAIGFPKLQRLYLEHLEGLEEWGEVEEGAMPCHAMPPRATYHRSLQEIASRLTSPHHPSKITLQSL